jgi:hypothetical protein
VSRPGLPKALIGDLSQEPRVLALDRARALEHRLDLGLGDHCRTGVIGKDLGTGEDAHTAEDDGHTCLVWSDPVTTPARCLAGAIRGDVVLTQFGEVPKSDIGEDTGEPVVLKSAE